MVRYSRGVRITDLVIITVAVELGQWVRLGTSGVESAVRFHLLTQAISLMIIVCWYVVLRLTRCHSWGVIGSGGAEYVKILQASLYLLGGLAMVDVVFNVPIVHRYLIALALGTVGLLFSRRCWRLFIKRGRRTGANSRRVVVVGDPASARALTERLEKHSALGYHVVGECRADAAAAIADVRCAVESSGATTVAVTSASAMGHAAMRELSWELSGLGVELLVSPGLIDIAGPRLSMRPQAGVPLLFVEHPTYRGSNGLFKLTFDKVLAVLAILVLSPVLLACALAVVLDSKGPVFYRGERIGVGNCPFRMWKFRSMVVDADRQRAALAERNEGNAVLFKLHDDPRVTRVGKVLRRFSLDELPQLFNVVGGSMSLVGPRPPLRAEVETYDHIIHRRMLVRPGMTGLWQVSGRSDLSWEQSVQLDLSYVENWSLAGDVALLWRTVGAVLAKDGAY